MTNFRSSKLVLLSISDGYDQEHTILSQAPVFSPGSRVRGRVSLECAADMRFRSLSVTLKGMSRVRAPVSKFQRALSLLGCDIMKARPVRALGDVDEIGYLDEKK